MNDSLLASPNSTLNRSISSMHVPLKLPNVPFLSAVIIPLRKDFDKSLKPEAPSPQSGKLVPAIQYKPENGFSSWMNIPNGGFRTPHPPPLVTSGEVNRLTEELLSRVRNSAASRDERQKPGVCYRDIGSLDTEKSIALSPASPSPFSYHPRFSGNRITGSTVFDPGDATLRAGFIKALRFLQIRQRLSVSNI